MIHADSLQQQGAYNRSFLCIKNQFEETPLIAFLCALGQTVSHTIQTHSDRRPLSGERKKGGGGAVCLGRHHCGAGWEKEKFTSDWTFYSRWTQPGRSLGVSHFRVQSQGDRKEETPEVLYQAGGRISEIWLRNFGAGKPDRLQELLTYQVKAPSALHIENKLNGVVWWKGRWGWSGYFSS